MKGMMAASCNMPSPMSQFRSIDCIILMVQIEVNIQQLVE
jgi:hypothetical protein